MSSRKARRLIVDLLRIFLGELFAGARLGRAWWAKSFEYSSFLQVCVGHAPLTVATLGLVF